MFDWTSDSLLKFHPEKCGVMRIGKDNIQVNYKMGMHDLRKTEIEQAHSSERVTDASRVSDTEALSKQEVCVCVLCIVQISF